MKVLALCKLHISKPLAGRVSLGEAGQVQSLSPLNAFLCIMSRDFRHCNHVLGAALHVASRNLAQQQPEGPWAARLAQLIQTPWVPQRTQLLSGACVSKAILQVFCGVLLTETQFPAVHRCPVIPPLVRLWVWMCWGLTQDQGLSWAGTLGKWGLGSQVIEFTPCQLSGPRTALQLSRQTSGEAAPPTLVAALLLSGPSCEWLCIPPALQW